MTRRTTNPDGNRLYLEAKARFKPFAPGLLIRRQRHFDIFGACLSEPDKEPTEERQPVHQRGV